MNGKMSKRIRSMARTFTKVHNQPMTEVAGTSRIKTDLSGKKYATVTLAHPKGSYRNELKFWKHPTRVENFDPDMHAPKTSE